MLLARGRYFLVHKQTIYWGAVSLVFAAYILRAVPLPIGFGRQLTVSSQTIPALIVMFAIGATSVWSYWFLNVPMIKRTFNDSSFSSISFHVLFGLSVIGSGILFFVYLYAVAVSDANNATPHVLDEVFAQLGPIGNALHTVHLMLFVGIYTMMDWIAARCAGDDDDRNLFSSIVMFVDVPILITMLFVTFVLRPALQGYAYFFEAGVISFQLIAGSLAVVGLEYFEKREAAARRAVVAVPSPAPIAPATNPTS